MNKKVLIISSDNTGHGHKSITESLCEKIKNEDVQIHVVDGFSMGGDVLLKIGKFYGPLTRTAEQLWKFVWNLSALAPSLVNHFVEALIKDNFLTLIEKFQPDVILSVHPNFNGSVINILEKNHLKIPFITLIADLVNIYPLWADQRADYIISPTEEAKLKCIEYGVPVDRIKVLGFPVRSRFFSKEKVLKRFYPNQRLKCLIMSGGEGVGNMKKIAENLLNNFDCSVKIIAGRNEKLKNQLENSLMEKYGERVEIYGFTKNIQDLMFESDIAFTRGSPNVMFEAIATNTPLIITGALPGQEQDNPSFAEKSNLGVVCKDVHNIKKVVADLLDNNAEKLNSIKSSQRQFININTANDIMEFILNVDEVGAPYYATKYAFS